MIVFYLLLLPFLVLGLGMNDKSSSISSPLPSVTTSSLEATPTISPPITVRVSGTMVLTLDKTNCTYGDKVSYTITMQNVPKQDPMFGETKIQLFSSNVHDFSYDVTSIISLTNLSNFQSMGTFIMERSGEVFIGCSLCFQEQCSHPLSVQNQSSKSIKVISNPPSSVKTPSSPALPPSFFTKTVLSQPTYVNLPPKLPPFYPPANGIIKSEPISIKVILMLIFIIFVYYLV